MQYKLNRIIHTSQGRAEVLIIHYPLAGVSVAYHMGSVVATREYGKMIPPDTDSDQAWEEFQARFEEKGYTEDIELSCLEYFAKLELTQE